jgi:NAD(P)-dependent dehydrogenase (short-subunit alcohol dehydrogenase family)
MEQPVRAARSLQGRVAIVTGAGAAGDGIGNGRAAAILLAEDGATVICVDMAKDPVVKTVEMIEKDGKGVAIAASADVTKEEDCKRIVDMALEKYGRVDILVNNVGVGGPKGTAVEVDMVEWAKGMEINVASMVTMAKFAIPAMLKNESDGYWKGSIVNLGSVAGLRGGTPRLLYPTTKGAVVNMTRAMATHHGKDGIRVNCVCPGMCWKKMSCWWVDI